MAEIASAFVTLVPSFKGGAAAISRELAGPSDAAGKEGGKKLGGGLLGGVGKFAAPIGAAIAGLVAVDKIAELFGSALEQGAANAKAGAQLGLSPGQAKKLGKATGAIYADNFGTSLDQVNEAGVTLSKGLGVSFNSVSFKPLTGKLLNITNTFDQDMPRVVGAAATLVRTGLAKNADEAFDIITKGLQSNANQADDLLDTYTEYGTQFRKLGIDGKTMTGIINQGLAGGARNGDLVADAFKELSIRAVDGSKLTGQGFKMLGLNGKTMGERFAKGGKSARDALDLTLDRLRKIKDPVKRNQAAVALFGTQAEDLGDALFKIDPSTAVKSIGKVGGAADGMAKTLNSTPKAALDGFKRRLGQGLTEAAGTAITSVQDAGPKVQAALGKLFGDGGQLSSVSDTFTKLKDAVLPALSGIATTITDTLGPAFGDFWTAVQPVVDWLIGAIGDDLVNAFKFVATVVQGALDIISGILNIFTGAFTGDWSKTWDGIKQVASGIWGIIKGLFTLFMTSALPQILKWGGGLLASLASWVWGKLKELFRAGMEAAKGLVQRGIDAVVGFFRGLPGKAMSAVNSLKQKATDFMSRTMASAKKAVSDGVGKLVGKIGEIPGKAVSALGDLGSTLYDAGASLISGLISGITDKIGALKRKLGEITSMIPDLKGPPARDAKLLTENGRLIMQGLIGGIDSGKPALRSTLGDLTNAMPGMLGNPGLTAGLAGTSSPEIRVFIGDRELTDIVRTEVSEGNRTTRKRVLAGAGANW